MAPQSDWWLDLLFSLSSTQRKYCKKSESGTCSSNLYTTLRILEPAPPTFTLPWDYWNLLFLPLHYPENTWTCSSYLYTAWEYWNLHLLPFNYPDNTENYSGYLNNTLRILKPTLPTFIIPRYYWNLPAPPTFSLPWKYWNLNLLPYEYWNLFRLPLQYPENTETNSSYLYNTLRILKPIPNTFILLWNQSLLLIHL